MTKQKLNVAFFWHMHQPSYYDPETNVSAMPWVRLHCMKDYFDMGKMLEEVEGAKAVVNFVPSLWDQIEAIAAGEFLDEHEILARKPEIEYTIEEKHFLSKHFFSCPYDTMIKPYPRFDALYQAYASDTGEVARIEQASEKDLRDIVVWYHLAWCGHTLQTSETVSPLLEKAENFTHEEKIEFLDAIRAFIREIPAYWKSLSERGIAELSTTPYYHPILPILIDPKSPLVACPGMELPSGGMTLIHDAKLHVTKAIEKHEALFGEKPKGFWPAEGSVSPEAAKMFEEHGAQWIATDEECLRLSLGLDSLDAAEKYKLRRYGKVAIFFRDHGLSDKIGFQYQKADQKESIEDFISHLKNIREALPEEGDFAVPVILDGENCWEHYDQQGRPFLLGLYRRLVEEEGFTLSTFQEILDEASAIEPMETLHSGSWIFADFTTWIGDPVKNKAWTLLYDARRAMEQKLAFGGLSQESMEKLVDNMLAAEGSDWFWWFGEGHSSAYDAHFDKLFRKRLQTNYRLLGEAPPEVLANPVENRWQSNRPYILPAYRIRPEITGRETRYWDWLPAGKAYPQSGSMQRVDIFMNALFFGFDEETLYFRIDSKAFSQMDDAREFAIGFTFSKPMEKQILLALPKKKETVKTAKGILLAFDKCLEVALPFDMIKKDFTNEDELALRVILYKNDREIESLPEQTEICFPYPSDVFDENTWFV